ncbi:MAG: ferrochelatase [Desulfobacterales bacterium]|nr:MAG: ferrochelatase [Desulfobacterales bacterium]
MPEESTGVILLNMGGPDSLKSVRPFLYNLFSDRDIIQLGPAFMQKYIAAFIAWRRAPKSGENYRRIGGKSPLAEITAAQAAALAGQLQPHGRYYVTMAMRYWQPYPAEALDFLLQKGVTRLVALTLYPQYSRATTGSSVKFLQQELARRSCSLPLTVIDSWPAQPQYLQVMATGILHEIHELEQKGVVDIAVVYSAHSLPRSFIDQGDPYVDHLKESIAGIEKLTGRKGRLCYQSRSGPVEWLAPSTPEMLATLAAEGCKGVVMVPVSFVSDHVETLYEIDMLYRQMAEEYGMAFASSASLNTNPDFIRALAELVLDRN